MALAIIILDAVGPNAVRQLGMQNLLELYNEFGEVFTCSGIPHTAPSNSLLFSGREEYRFWVKFLNKRRLTQRVDPATFFDRDEAAVKTKDVRLWTREDYEYPFLWELVAAQGLDAVAYDIPVVLPPVRFNAEDAPDTDNWFPDSMKRCRNHVREAVNYTFDKISNDDLDLFATSIQVPDKWFHGLGGDFPDAPGINAESIAAQFVETEATWLDTRLPRLIDTCVENGMDWVVMGDHGPPMPGALPVTDIDGTPFVLPRHRKHSMIITNLSDPPRYTADFFPWICRYFGIKSTMRVDVLGSGVRMCGGEKEGDAKDVLQRLGRLGYL